MKKKGHPPYQEVLFIDTATGHKFICGTTLQPEETEEFEGKTYPVYKVPVSSKSHPFFTGSQQFVDTEGRVDKFKKRYSQTQKKSAEMAKAKKEAEEKEKELKKAAKKTAPKKAATTAKKPAAPKKSTTTKKTETKKEAKPATKKAAPKKEKTEGSAEKKKPTKAKKESSKEDK